jgi:glycosyltransferase involved in cell wall biosynthesis
MQWWFGLYLRTAELLGYAIVWTAHDLLPHQRVFEDDRRGRDLLIAKAKTIIALSEATAAELRALGARTIRVIPIGPYSGPYPVTLTRKEARASFGFHDDDVVMALIGRIESYKGADLLLVAAAQLPPTSHIKILLAGHCADHTYANNLQRLVRETNGRALSRLQWIADEELASYYQAADFAVFPFREITNSASVLLALSFEKPIIIPDLPTLGDIPDSAAIWFDPARGRLGDALLRAERLTDEERQEMSDVGYAWANRSDWSEIARDTIDAYEEALRR